MKNKLLFTLLISLLINTVVLSKNNNEPKTNAQDTIIYVNFSAGLALPQKEFSNGGIFLRDGGHAGMGLYGEIFISYHLFNKFKPLNINFCGLFSSSIYDVYYDSIPEMIPNIDNNYDWELQVSGWKITSFQLGFSPILQVSKFLDINGRILGGFSKIKRPFIEAKTIYNGTEYIYTIEDEEKYALSYTIGAGVRIKISKTFGIALNWDHFGSSAKFSSTIIPELQHTEIHKPTYLQEFKSNIYTIGISISI